MDIKELKEKVHKMMEDENEEVDLDDLYNYIIRTENKEIDEEEDFINYLYKFILYSSLNDNGVFETFDYYPKTLNHVNDIFDELSPYILLELSSYYEENKDYDNYFKCLNKGAHYQLQGMLGGISLVSALIDIDSCRYYLAKCYMEGTGCEKDYVEAFRLLYDVRTDHLLQKNMGDPIEDEFLELYHLMLKDFQEGKDYPGLCFVLGIMSIDGLGINISTYDLNEFMYLEGIHHPSFFEKYQHLLDRVDQSVYEINIKPITKKIKKGDYVQYKRYNHRLVLWKVLDVKDGKALLISRDVLESTYVAERRGRDNCYKNYVSNMFSFDEDDINEGKPFILSKDEVIKYMHRLESRIGGVRYQASINGYDNYGSTEAYFTSTKYQDDYYYFVDQDGNINIDNIQRNYIGLRPAIWIKLTDDYDPYR